MPRFVCFRWLLCLPCAIVWGLLLGATTPPAAAQPQTGFQERLYRDEKGPHRYTIFVPARYTSDVKWPVILYLHGASARGTDNIMPTVGGLGTQVRARAESFPFLVVFPQSEDLDGRVLEGWEADSPDGKRALKILDAVEQEFNVDRSREIITGWSMGGTGAWQLAAACPDRWAAVVILAGKAQAETAARLKNVRIWAFHGMLDHAVAVEQSRQMIGAIRAAGGRAVLTELPDIGHNIGHVVYGSDAVYDWMANPQAAPIPETIVRSSTRPPTNAEMGRDLEFPFVPAVEVPDAFYVRLDNSVLESVATSLPEMIPEQALSGVKADVHETSRSFLTHFDIDLSGMSYHGQVEQIRIATDRDGWVNLEIGLRNMTFEIGQTRVTGRMTSATAGPMRIVVGQSKPVWLPIRVRPHVENRRFQVEVDYVDFRIPEESFEVTTPEAVGSGLPFFRERVASGVTHDMVTKAHDRKGEIEAQIAAMVPALVKKFEGRIGAFFETARTVVTKLPVPTYLPRYKLWPSQVHVDETGLVMSLGITFARPGLNPKPQQLRQIVQKPVDLARLPRAEGFQLGVAAGCFEAMTAAAANAEATSADVRDLGVRKFFALCDRQTMIGIIPDLARYGDSLEVRTRFELVEPVTFEGAPEAAGKRNDLMKLTMMNLRAAVQIRTSAHEYHWTRCAEFDMKMDYLARLHVDKPTFERRLLVADTFSNPKACVTGRFAAGYHPLNPVLRAERVAEIFASGWKDEGPTEFLHGAFHMVKLRDFAIGPAKVRLADAAWSDPYLVCFYRQPRTRITNDGRQPLIYSVRGPQTDWSQPLTLDAGKSHDYAVPYPVTVKTGGADTEPHQVPLGVDFKLGAPAVGTPVSTASGPATRGDSRQ